MKKILLMLTAFVLLLSYSGVGLLAEGKLNSKYEGYETRAFSVKENGYEKIEISRKQENAAFRSSGQEPSIIVDMEMTDGTLTHFERTGDTGYYYVNGELVSTVEYGQMSKMRLSIPTQIRTVTNSPMPGFSSYYYTGYEDWVISQIKGLARDAAITLIINTLLGGLPAYFALGYNALYSSASGLYSYCTVNDTFSDQSLRAVTVFYGSYHGQCNILAWYGTRTFSLKKAWSSEIDTNSGTTFVRNSDHTWNGNPNDYTQPAACRALANYDED